jgi:hypothetical protein
MAMANISGDMSCLPEAEPKILAETLHKMGHHDHLLTPELGQLSAVATGVVRRVEGVNTYLETEVYNREVCCH